jgi:hypothetical protein
MGRTLFLLIGALCLVHCGSYEARVAPGASYTKRAKTSEGSVVVANGPELGFARQFPDLYAAGAALCPAYSAAQIAEATPNFDWQEGHMESGPFRHLATVQFANTRKDPASAPDSELRDLMLRTTRDLGGNLLAVMKMSTKPLGEGTSDPKDAILELIGIVYYVDCEVLDAAAD